MGRPLEIFLDVETDYHRQLTVVGFRSRKTGVVQLVGSQITRRRLRLRLPAAGRLYTYNGHGFDLPKIKNQLGLDLHEVFDCVDLMRACHDINVYGGQKPTEKLAGYLRPTTGLDGRDAIRLWAKHLAGNAKALPLLLRYNEDDLEGLVHIRRWLGKRGAL